MSTKKKGLLTTSGEWAKHLRKWGRQRFWSKERMAARKTIRKEKNDDAR